MARVILDSGFEITSIGEALVTQMFTQLEEDRLQIPFENGPQTVLTTTGLPVEITLKTVPKPVSLRTPWGAVDMPPITFSVRPGNNDVVVFGRATMKELGIDLYPMAMEKLRPRAVPVQFRRAIPLLSSRQAYIFCTSRRVPRGGSSCGCRSGAISRSGDRQVDGPCGGAGSQGSCAGK